MPTDSASPPPAHNLAAMRETKHALRVDPIGCKLIATCVCGEWTREDGQRYDERVTATFARIDEAFARHLADCGAATGKQERNAGGYVPAQQTQVAWVGK